MTDSKYTSVLKRAAKAYNVYLENLIKAQNEYQRRYGMLPGDHDNDSWIDSIEGGGGAANEDVTADLVDEWAAAHGAERITK